MDITVNPNLSEDEKKKATERLNQAKEWPVLSLEPFKLKDKAGRGGVIYDLESTFGFLPKQIGIQKVQGKHDTYILSAVLTPEQIEKDKKRFEEQANKKQMEVEHGKNA